VIDEVLFAPSAKLNRVNCPARHNENEIHEERVGSKKKSAGKLQRLRLVRRAALCFLLPRRDSQRSPIKSSSEPSEEQRKKPVFSRARFSENRRALRAAARLDSLNG
jgi:hypothetical protein